MVYPTRLKIIIGLVVVVAVGSGIVGIEYSIHPPNRALLEQGEAPQSVPVASVHTANWYVAHPGIAKRDEVRCGSNAATISPAACQNVKSAEEQLLADKMQKAALSNSSLTKPTAVKAP